MVKNRYAKNPNKLQSELKELNETQVIDKNLHEAEIEFLPDYEGEFEMVGKVSVGDQFRTTHIRFRNNTDYEHFIIAVDEGGYDSDDAIFIVLFIN